MIALEMVRRRLVSTVIFERVGSGSVESYFALRHRYEGSPVPFSAWARSPARDCSFTVFFLVEARGSCFLEGEVAAEGGATEAQDCGPVKGGHIQFPLLVSRGL
jgi:hypothetical protein